MTHLSEFSGQESELLMSLPYKVGMYISYADDEDGEHDDVAEQKALKHCLKAIIPLYDEKPFVQDILKKSMSFQSEWERWGTQAFHAPREAEKAITLLRSKASLNELKSFRAALMEIATTVAQAHGEFSSFDEEEQESGFSALVGKIVGGFSGLSKDDDNHPMNISASEDSAIQTLKEALTIKA